MGLLGFEPLLLRITNGAFGLDLGAILFSFQMKTYESLHKCFVQPCKKDILMVYSL